VTQLYVRVQLHGAVADQRLCSVGDEVWLGSAPDAVVAFPGPSIQVRRFGRRLQVQGRWLEPGHPMRLRRGELEVVLEAVEAAHMAPEWSLPMPDLRVLVASAAVVLLGAWWEAVGTFLERHPEAVAALTGSESAVVVQHVGASGDAAAEPMRAQTQVERREPIVEDTGTADTAEPVIPTSYPVGFIERHPPAE
jgi:hypothetical protein